ncbi:hypothetical protein [Neisseria animaloris]|uniref:hypothetical protein n=1 Tax=Neisseria animaloris TaxID=326522 RepID=UPI000D36091E|nr:hypothetical protein [Neisseria animaloris]
MPAPTNPPSASRNKRKQTGLSRLAVLSVLLTALALNGYGYNGRAFAAAPVAAAPQSEVFYQGNLLENAAALQAAEDALKNLPLLQGKAVNVYESVDFFDGVRPRIEVDIQDPNQPEKIDHYIYERSRWTLTQTMRIPAAERITRYQYLTPLAKVRFTDVVPVARNWSAKAKTIDAVITEPYYISFVLLGKQKKRFWHTATIEAVGAQYYLSFHEDGKVWEFKKL